MLLPPRTTDQPHNPPTRPATELPELPGPHPRSDRPALERFAPPPWERDSPQRIAIDDDLAADHLARVIDEAVDQLDLTDLFDSYAGVGSRAHRPDLFLKIVLYEIQIGCHSPDQWARDARDRRSVQWLGLGITPSRTRCYAFRDRLGPLLEVLHRQVLQGALARGLTTARQGALDGTLIAARASRHRLINLTRLERRLADLDRVLAAQASGRDPRALPAWMARPPATRRRQRHRFAVARRELLRRHTLNARRSRDKRLDPEKIVISTSESEAALGRDKEKVFRPLYNVQVVQDLESPLVLGYEVFAQATDAGTLMPLRQRAWGLTGVWRERMLADSTYASALDLVDRAAAGVDLYAPYQENDRSESRRARRPPRQFPKDRFVWCAEEQVYVCPRGHRLERIGQERRARGEGRSIALTTYRCAKEHCQACPLAQQCTTSAQGRTI